MRTHTTLATFRRVARSEESMMRAMMPRIAAVSEPLPTLHAPVAVIASVNGLRLVRPLTYTLAEVTRG